MDVFKQSTDLAEDAGWIGMVLNSGYLIRHMHRKRKGTQLFLGCVKIC